MLIEFFGSAPEAGGARTKASVRDDTSLLWLAKFPAVATRLLAKCTVPEQDDQFTQRDAMMDKLAMVYRSFRTAPKSSPVRNPAIERFLSASIYSENQNHH